MLFKKIKHNNGKREIYLGKKKIFSIYQSNQIYRVFRKNIVRIKHSKPIKNSKSRVWFPANFYGGGS